MPFRGPKVFLCYAREDRRCVELMHERLKVLRFRPWMDVHELSAGDDWEARIASAVKDSHFFLMFLSTAAVEKNGYQEREFEFARNAAAEMPPGSVFMVPARLDNCSVPADIQRFQGCDLFENAGFERMIMAMRSQRGPVVIARFFNRWLRLGLGVSAALLMVALLLARTRSAPWIVEHELVSAILAIGVGSLTFWFLAGGVLRRTVNGVLAGLIVCIACVYVLLFELDVYPVSDVARAFSLSNPNGEWSYGYTKDLGSPLTPIPIRDSQVNDGAEGFSLPVRNYSSIPLILRNPKPYTIKRLGLVHLPPNIVEMHPGWEGEYAVVRWTAPKTGIYRIWGYFIGLHEVGPSTDVYVVLNSQSQIPLFDADIESFGRPRQYDFVSRITAGDTLDFSVGNGRSRDPNNRGDPNNDSTGLTASIAAVE